MMVKSNLPSGRVALWERHPDHPGGEVMVNSDRPVEVAETMAVRDALRRGALVEIDQPKPAIKTTAKRRKVS